MKKRMGFSSNDRYFMIVFLAEEMTSLNLVTLYQPCFRPVFSYSDLVKRAVMAYRQSNPPTNRKPCPFPKKQKQSLTVSRFCFQVKLLTNTVLQQ